MSCAHTFVKSVHIKLSDERRDIGVFEVLAGISISSRISLEFLTGGNTNERTFENSDVGDMTKLSLVLDQEIRCWIPGSSNILFW